MTVKSTEPIACTLDAGDFRARTAAIAALNNAALRDHQRDDLRLILTFASEAGERVREMVRQEQACCAFLTFTLDEMDDAIRLTIDVPENARDAAGQVFDIFQAKKPAAASCC